MIIFKFKQRLLRCCTVLACICLLLAEGTAHAAEAIKKTNSTSSTNKASAKPSAGKTLPKTQANKSKPTKSKSAKAKSASKGKTGKKSKRGSVRAPVPVKPIFNAKPITGPKFTTARASLKVIVNGEDIPYQLFFTTLVPGRPLNIKVEGQEHYQVTLDGKPLTGENNTWVWQAPNTPGYHQAQVVEQLTQKTLTLHVFVLSTLKNGSDSIAGFTIGRYPPPKDGKAQYNAPLGFIEVNASNQHLYISPHFQLGQFLCRQKDGLPQYISLVPDLLEKLEWLLEAVNQRGTRLDTFEVMSGFRTPFYNRMIRNVVHSRHIYGSAADIFIDVKPRDGVMDDLNHDGRHDKKDADVLYNLADAISEAHPHLSGGVGQYSGNGAHGPFVHVDVRGFDARWGK